MMACSTQDNGKLIRWKEMASALGMMEKSTEASGKMTFLRDKGSSHTILGTEKLSIRDNL
jgi:hypothetical protein